MRQEGERLTNETIKNYLDKCITRGITHIHAFAFVFSSSGGINREGIESMIFVKKNYPAMKEFFILIITHGEEKNEEEQEHFVDEFFQHPDVVKHKLQEFFGARVFSTGCLRPQLASNPNMEAAQMQARNILAMRKKLPDYLVQCETKTYNVHYPSKDESLVAQVFNSFSAYKMIITWIVLNIAILIMLIKWTK